MKQNAIIQLCASQSVGKPSRFRDKSYPSLAYLSDFFDTSQPVKGSAGMIVVRAVVMGPKQPSEKTPKRKKIVPPRWCLNPQAASPSRGANNRQTLSEGTALGRVGMKPALLLIQFSVESLDC